MKIIQAVGVKDFDGKWLIINARLEVSKGVIIYPEYLVQSYYKLRLLRIRNNKGLYQKVIK